MERRTIHAIRRDLRGYLSMLAALEEMRYWEAAVVYRRHVRAIELELEQRLMLRKEGHHECTSRNNVSRRTHALAREQHEARNPSDNGGSDAPSGVGLVSGDAAGLR